MRILTGRRFRTERLLFSPDGRYLSSVVLRRSPYTYLAQVWETTGDTSPRHTVDENTAVVSFRPDSRHLLLHAAERWLSLDLVTGEVSPEMELMALKPTAVSPDGVWAVFANRDEEEGTLRLKVARWMGDGWREVWTQTLRGTTYDEYGNAPADQWDGFSTWYLTSNGTRIVIVSTPGDEYGQFGESVHRVLDTATGTEVFEWLGDLPVYTLPVRIGPHEHLVYLYRRELYVIPTQVPNTAPITRTNTSRKHFTAAAFSPDGRLLATTSNDTTVTMWDTATWQPIRQYGWEIGKLRAVAFAPDGLTCAAGSDTGKVVLFDVDG